MKQELYTETFSCASVQELLELATTASNSMTVHYFTTFTLWEVGECGEFSGFHLTFLHILTFFCLKLRQSKHFPESE